MKGTNLHSEFLYLTNLWDPTGESFSAAAAEVMWGDALDCPMDKPGNLLYGPHFWHFHLPPPL